MSENMNENARERLFCLDLLRGLDMFLLTLLGPFVTAGLFKTFPPSESTLVFWKHSLTSFAGQGCVPTGWGIWDFGQPLFIFICGAAVPFAIPKRLDADGHPTAAFWKHVLGRVAMLWALGMLIRGILTFDLSKFTPYSDTLQTIAVAYLGASLALLIRRAWARLALALGLIAAFGVIQATCGDYTQFGNVSRIIDEKLFGMIGCHGKDFCYILTTMVWAAMGILGSLAAEVLKSSAPAWTKVRRLGGCGCASLAVGLLLSVWIPPIRYIYTVSFVFQTLGVAILLLDALFVLTDIWRWRRGLGFFILLGQCSLFCWMLSTFFRPGLGRVADQIVVGVPRLLGSDAFTPLVYWTVYVILFSWCVFQWRKLRQLRRQEASKGGCRKGKERM